MTQLLLIFTVESQIIYWVGATVFILSCHSLEIIDYILNGFLKDLRSIVTIQGLLLLMFKNKYEESVLRRNYDLDSE